MKKFLFFLVFIFAIIQNLRAQETILYGIANTSQGCNVVSFDYTSQTYDSVFHLPFSLYMNTSITFNPFKKIIYFCTSPGTITAINIDSANYYNVAYLTDQISGCIIELQYDYFSNSIILEDLDAVRRYNLNNQTLELITNVYHIGATSNGTPRSAYNQINQNFYAINIIDTGNYNFIYYSILVDCYNNNIIDTVNFTTNNSFGLLTYNFTDNQYYAYNTNRKEVIRISSLNEEQTTICNFDYHSLLDNQQAAFDYNKGLYLLPFYLGSPKLAIVDVNTGNVNIINFQEFDYQLYFGGRNPLLKRDGNFLIGSYCDNYTWYLNENLIQDSISQTIYPAEAGYYKFSTTIGTETYFSNKIYIDFSSINEIKNNVINIVMFPNPATDYLTIVTPQKTTVEILNINGQIIKTIFTTNKQTTIDVRNLSSGVYIIKVRTEKGVAVKKFIKE